MAGFEDCALHRQQRQSANSIPLPHLPYPNITSVKMAGLLGKKFPAPVGTFNALHFDLLRQCARLLTLLL
jgi:hypothetical protein